MAYTQKEKQTPNCSEWNAWLTATRQQDMTDWYKEMLRGECRRSEGSLCSHTLFAKYHSTNATARVQKALNKKYYSRVLPMPSGTWPLEVLPILQPLPTPQYPPGLSHTVHFQGWWNNPHWGSGEYVTRCLSTPQHKHLCWDQALTITGTQAALKPPSRLGKCCEMVPT